ncbi:transposase [Solidesulfovibrio magneticus]
MLRFPDQPHDAAGRAIADIYNERWQIEIFFRFIKQNLKIKSFLGNS